MRFGRKMRKATTAAESESRRQKDFNTIQGYPDNVETVTLSLPALQTMDPSQESKPNETTPGTGNSPKRKVTILSPKVVHKLKSIKPTSRQEIYSYNSPGSSKCILSEKESPIPTIPTPSREPIPYCILLYGPKTCREQKIYAARTYDDKYSPIPYARYVYFIYLLCIMYYVLCIMY
jgi:hypothetical protein